MREIAAQWGQPGYNGKTRAKNVVDGLCQAIGRDLSHRLRVEIDQQPLPGASPAGQAHTLGQLSDRDPTRWV